MVENFAKITSLLCQAVLLLTLVVFLIFFLTGYDSAFEADQSCHSDLSNLLDQSGNLGCDHDTETHQWILFENQDNSKAAKIIKKYRYKFL